MRDSVELFCKGVDTLMNVALNGHGFAWYCHRRGGFLSEVVEAYPLLLVEVGADVPTWLDLSQIEYLDQSPTEGHQAYVERVAQWLQAHPGVTTVVVALSTSDTPVLEERVRSFGKAITTAIDARPKARLLFGAPASTSERQRRRLLAVTAELAQCDASQRACVVGAHFSAHPPSSSRIPIGTV